MSRSPGYYGQSIGGHGVHIEVELFNKFPMTLRILILCCMNSQVTGGTGLTGQSASALS